MTVRFLIGQPVPLSRSTVFRRGGLVRCASIDDANRTRRDAEENATDTLFHPSRWSDSGTADGDRPQGGGASNRAP